MHRQRTSISQPFNSLRQAWRCDQLVNYYNRLFGCGVTRTFAHTRTRKRSIAQSATSNTLPHIMLVRMSEACGACGACGACPAVRCVYLRLGSGRTQVVRSPVLIISTRLFEHSDILQQPSPFAAACAHIGTHTRIQKIARDMCAAALGSCVCVARAHARHEAAHFTF